MMWRTAPEPSAAMILRPDTAAHRLTARSRDRGRLRLVGGLRSVARRSHTAARVRRYDVLLYERAADSSTPPRSWRPPLEAGGSSPA